MTHKEALDFNKTNHPIAKYMLNKQASLSKQNNIKFQKKIHAKLFNPISYHQNANKNNKPAPFSHQTKKIFKILTISSISKQAETLYM